jgi:hypothetical protein
MGAAVEALEAAEMERAEPVERVALEVVVEARAIVVEARVVVMVARLDTGAVEAIGVILQAGMTAAVSQRRSSSTWVLGRLCN